MAMFNVGSVVRELLKSSVPMAPSRRSGGT